MGGISDEQVEWAVVNRLRAMLEAPPKTEFNVTQTFALFSSVLMWSKNRMFATVSETAAADEAARSLRRRIKETRITEEPWLLANILPTWGDSTNGPKLMTERINGDFDKMEAEAFFKWLRDAIAHGDGRVIRPLHKPSRDYSREWLGGFIIEFPERQGSSRKLTLSLTEAEMRRLGTLLADAFCSALAGGYDYSQRDVATRVVEAAA